MSRVSVRVAVAAILAAATSLPGHAGTLSGFVRDGSGTQYLQSAELLIVELGRRVETRADGSFRFVDIPDGTYTLRVRYVGAEPVDLRVNVVGDTAGTEVRLAASQEAVRDDGLESLLVVGQRASLSSALSRQRAADGVESVLTRDAIGQFPDQNVAESIRRLSGVNVLNDQGEGRFVAVRGLDPGLNAASINGVRVPSPGADERAVALDVIPSEIIESIEIKKSLTPDMDGDTIGASIEINTTSAFDRAEPWAALTTEGSYNDLNGEWSPKAGLNFSTRIGDRFGIAGGVSYYRRRFASDNIELDGWDETDDGFVYADTVEYRDYDVVRTRFGANLSLDFRLSDQTTLFTRLLHSKFEDQEYRSRLIFEMDEAPGSASATGASFSSDDGEIKVLRDIKDRYEAQTIDSVALGGKTFSGGWTFNYLASWSRANEKENGSVDPVEFTRAFEEPGEFDVSFDYSDLNRPTYRVGAGRNTFFNAQEFGFDTFERTTLSLAEDEEVAFKVDIERAFALGAGELTVKAGAKLRQRDKGFNLQLDVFDGFDGDFTLADVVGRSSFGLAVTSPIPSGPAVRLFTGNNVGAFEQNAVDTAFESNVANYESEEDITAGYLMGRYEQGPLRVVGGVRMEHTRTRINANLVELVEEGSERNGVAVDEDTVFVAPNGFTRSYTDVLPSLNVRYELARDVVLRGGLYASLSRPNMGQLAPRFLVEQNDEGRREGEFGNPDLQPYKAWNFDFSAEWYLGSAGVLQAGVFAKRIDDFIVPIEVDDVTFNGIFANQAVIPVNGEQATVQGLEFSYQQSLTFLPGALSGLLLGVNYTYTDTEGEVAGRRVPLPAASEHTYNLTLGYERGPLNLRLTAAYRDEYLDELGSSAEDDRYVTDFIQYDFTAKYRVTPKVQLFAELINIGDRPFVAYRKGGGRPGLFQYEEYSWTAKTGFRVNF